jgi:predicted site-specific integrase-resolvase
MELFTLASAAERIGCTPNRLKVWIDKGYVPEMRIQMGKVRARVVDEESIEKIKRVLEAQEREGLAIQGAFARHFNNEEVNDN